MGISTGVDAPLPPAPARLDLDPCLRAARSRP